MQNILERDVLGANVGQETYLLTHYLLIVSQTIDRVERLETEVPSKYHLCISMV